MPDRGNDGCPLHGQKLAWLAGKLDAKERFPVAAEELAQFLPYQDMGEAVPWTRTASMNEEPPVSSEETHRMVAQHTRIASIAAVLPGLLAITALARGIEAMEQLKVRISWGHRTAFPTAFYVKLAGREGMLVEQPTPVGLEDGEGQADGAWQTRAGGGDVDGIDAVLRYPQPAARQRRQEHSIWTHLLREADPDTAHRLRDDPAFMVDPPMLTVQMDPEGTRGFSVSVGQLLTNRGIWVPALDVFVSVGSDPLSFADHQRELEPLQGKRTLDQVQANPEASYPQYTSLWADMGDPKNPHPSHVVCVGWDSTIAKFGIDRMAPLVNDLGNPDHFRLEWDVREGGEPVTWRGQRVYEGLPIVTTIIETPKARYEIEQFAYPLNGPPAGRRGDIAMVLMQRVTIHNTLSTAATLPLGISHTREWAATDTFAWTAPATGEGICFGTGRVTLLSVQGARAREQSCSVKDRKDKDGKVIGATVAGQAHLAVDVPPGQSRQVIVRLPSAPVSEKDRHALLSLDYESARSATIKFWSDWLSRRAQFSVPEPVVNELFRANLWHALRLPRRHGGQGPNVQIDLPYSNFAYGQNGTPWPVNQTIYVDYMLYDLRGYHDVSAEELAVMFRNNQEPNGHVGGYANWGVYTPSMIYAAAKHYLLSGDRASFEKLLPQTLKAFDWCQSEIRKASERGGPAAGLVLAPLNDLSHDPKAWAFNQAYLFAGPDLLARALAETGHPRAAEARAAAQAMFEAVQRGLAHASMLSPLVQLRDHTWMPYVPSDALTPRRLLEIWYPTDVDSGPLHLSRLKALDPNGPLTTYLLHDHEDNLFLKQWGMANEPVYNQQATAYLLRDEPKAAIRAFYSYLACAFSHSVLEPVEHRYAWGQYFGPPSTDGAWFDLYRHMLIHERDDGALLLLQATPRRWLEEGKRIEVRRAPTYYGHMSLSIESRAAWGKLLAEIEMPARGRPRALLLRLRHPEGKPIRSVTVNGRGWTDFDVQKEWVRIMSPAERRYSVVVSY